MNPWLRTIVIVTFVYLATTMVFTPWLTRFPMQIMLPAVILLSGIGLAGVLLHRMNWVIIPTLLALFLAIPIRVGPDAYYGFFGAVNFPLTMFSVGPRGTTSHFGLNLIPAGLLAAFLYSLFKVADLEREPIVEEPT